jgi:hypothetical protein
MLPNTASMAERAKKYLPFYRNQVPVMGRIFDALCEHPYGLSIRELVDFVYSDDPDGGPSWANNSINVTICRFNAHAKKEKLGVRIWSKNGRGTIHYGHRHFIFIVREPR